MNTNFKLPSSTSLEKLSVSWIFKNQQRFLVFLACLVLLIIAGLAIISVTYIENRTLSKFQNLTKDFTFDWLNVQSNGTKIELSGNPPDQIEYLGVLSLITLNFDPDGIINNIQEPKEFYKPKQSLDLQIYSKNDAVYILGSFANQIQKTKTLELLQTHQPGKPINDLSTLKADSGLSEFDSAVEFGTKIFSHIPEGVVSLAGQSVNVTSHLNSQNQVDVISTRLQEIKPDSIELNLDLTFPLPLIKPYKFGIYLDGENTKLETCHVDDKESNNRIVSILSSINPDQQFNCQFSLGIPFLGWEDLIVQLLELFSDSRATFLRVSDFSVNILSDFDLSDQKLAAMEVIFNRFPSEEFNVQILNRKEILERTNPEFLRIFIDVNNKITIYGSIPDKSLKSLILDIIAAYLLPDQIDDFTVIRQGSNFSDLNRITNGIKSLVHLEAGELVILENGIYLYGVVSSQSNRDALIQYLDSEFRIEEYFLDIEIDEAILLDRLLSPEQCQSDVEQILVDKKITFDSGSIEINNQTREIIVELATVLRQCGHLPWEIGGHTDNQGSESMNLELSTKRAEAILFALELEGVPIENIVAKGYGESSPISSNRTKAGRELNRRIVIQLLATEEDN